MVGVAAAHAQRQEVIQREVTRHAVERAHAAACGMGG
ncbi:hypothetical protein XOCgx_3680 [Xanthomonas oryzae pv. oryzicola]|nr:hypothetical protein XOCgx_3680 [Xanthomonas oryzae pv. oryzicola]